ncbi:MAG: diacylglycerol kinase [Candidatus Microbacterium phytovorans]|uniref:Diacylglycerol kinase n=1 Tax=Candidatus Microbacterium phytovorans TaxID=3121374 RepID=A0AAJ6B421_9MICO|nr:diacylglycerol kinase [Microbacterium sp.]WEK13852.1 MAG: diacylglycerol kinase [Microbacterium sp.]
MDVALLVNPAARAGAHTVVVDEVTARLRAHGIRVAVISGGSAADSSTLLRAALDVGTDAVLVAGGDGTVNLAIQELAGTDTPLGIVPVGTGNDFAAALGLRELRAEATAAAVIAGRTRRVDLARATRADGSSRLYATVLAAGFDSKVNDRANGMTWPRGHSRYDIAVLIEFLRLRDLPFRVELEDADGDVEVLDGPLVLASVGNGPTYGGGIRICPEAMLDDGLLDVTLVRPAGRLRLLRLLPRVYRGTHASSPDVVMRRARAVRLDAPALTAYADGDPLGALPVRVDAVPGALTVFTA